MRDLESRDVEGAAYLAGEDVPRPRRRLAGVDAELLPTRAELAADADHTRRRDARMADAEARDVFGYGG